MAFVEWKSTQKNQGWDHHPTLLSMSGAIYYPMKYTSASRLQRSIVHYATPNTPIARSSVLYSLSFSSMTRLHTVSRLSFPRWIDNLLSAGFVQMSLYSCVRPACRATPYTSYRHPWDGNNVASYILPGTSGRAITELASALQAFEPLSPTAQTLPPEETLLKRLCFTPLVHSVLVRCCLYASDSGFLLDVQPALNVRRRCPKWSPRGFAFILSRGYTFCLFLLSESARVRFFDDFSRGFYSSAVDFLGTILAERRFLHRIRALQIESTGR
ncbi:hypothetical protein BXZ70DRAFT_261576 [Cristinia sonorae]|uniref:Uncharacterized protein n=1 Tax=Cristinia sonorae TaxID=1940300 RepID=A0A8K0UX76_9AGAR|nr:hypothetical protein BXZ70DRAFT_261576 [Cristinia sonorae]